MRPPMVVARSGVFCQEKHWAGHDFYYSINGNTKIEFVKRNFGIARSIFCDTFIRMSDKDEPAKRGRPPLPKNEKIRTPLNMRVSVPFLSAAKKYGKRKNLKTVSAAVRDAAEETFRREGLIREKPEAS